MEAIDVVCNTLRDTISFPNQRERAKQILANLTKWEEEQREEFVMFEDKNENQ